MVFGCGFFFMCIQMFKLKLLIHNVHVRFSSLFEQLGFLWTKLIVVAKIVLHNFSFRLGSWLGSVFYSFWYVVRWDYYSIKMKFHKWNAVNGKNGKNALEKLKIEECLEICKFEFDGVECLWLQKKKTLFDKFVSRNFFPKW